MKITQKELTTAAQECGISQTDSDKLWHSLEQRAQWRPRFDLVHVLYYAGGLTIITAMSLLLNNAWQTIGPAALFTLSCVYFLVFLILAERFIDRQGMSVPAGLFATIAVVMVPLIIFSIQDWLGVWPGDQTPFEYRDFHVWIKSIWLPMEVITITVGVLVLSRYKLPFILMPVAVCLWYMSMDLAPLFMTEAVVRPDFATATQEEIDAYWESTKDFRDVRKWVSVAFGALMIFGAYGVDQRTQRDYAFWLYLFGVLAFWGGLTSMHSDSELGKFIYACINVFLVGAGVFLARKIFVIFGGIGVYIYIGHLASKVFEDSLLFPITMSLIGLMTIVMGVYLYRHGKAVEAALIARLPETFTKLRPQQRSLAPIDPHP